MYPGTKNIKMENHVKNRTCYYFYDIIKYEDFH